MSLPHSNPQLHDPTQPPPAPGTTVPDPSARANDSLPPLPKEQRTEEVALSGREKNAFDSERPLGVAPAPGGGVANGGQANLPEGHANMADKIVGKTQKVIGKYTNNPELHERGELRETGGKAAAEGLARAGHV